MHRLFFSYVFGVRGLVPCGRSEHPFGRLRGDEGGMPFRAGGKNSWYSGGGFGATAFFAVCLDVLIATSAV